MNRKDIYNQQRTDGVDANSTASVTDEVNVINAESVAIYIMDGSGTHATHVIKLLVSGVGEDDNSVEFMTIASDSGLTGLGCKLYDVTSFAFCKVSVTTAEGAASTIDILVNPIRNK